MSEKSGGAIRKVIPSFEHTENSSIFSPIHSMAVLTFTTSLAVNSPSSYKIFFFNGARKC